MAGNGAEQRAALWSRISAQLKTVADPSLSAAIEAEMVQRFEASFGHHPYRKSAGRQGTRAPVSGPAAWTEPRPHDVGGSRPLPDRWRHGRK